MSWTVGQMVWWHARSGTPYAARVVAVFRGVPVVRLLSMSGTVYGEERLCDWRNHPAPAPCDFKKSRVDNSDLLWVAPAVPARGLRAFLRRWFSADVG